VRKKKKPSGWRFIKEGPGREGWKNYGLLGWIGIDGWTGTKRNEERLEFQEAQF